jgi:SAM-dependent methyltransferase
MKWQLKFFRNAIFGIFPLSIQEKLRNIKRAFLPYDGQIDLWTLRQGLQQIEMLRMSGCEPYGKDYMELGTGWSPVIPLVFALVGCRSLTLVDSQRLMDNHTFAETCRKLLAYKEEISRRLHVATSDIEQQLGKLATMSLESALAELNCRYLAPSDLFSNGLQEHSLDIITSRAVLEHVHPIIVRNMFHEFQKLLRHGGVMCHIIDNSDHWEHNDKSISRLNFLKYSQRTFDLFSSMNPLDYQNRLRHFQYKKMIEDAGFRVVCDESPPDENTMAELDSLKIHPSFGQFSKEDLAVLTSYLVAAN